MSSKPLQLGALLPELCPAPPEKENIYVIGWTRPETQLPIFRMQGLRSTDSRNWHGVKVELLLFFLILLAWIGLQHQ